MNHTFRIDDVSINTDYKKMENMISILDKKYPDSVFVLGISPIVSDMSKDTKPDRVFPEIWNAYSDISTFYKADLCGLPTKFLNKLKSKYIIRLAGHGLIHVDHRLLSLEAQTMSIVTSCSLAKANFFIPPFNKWDTNTEKICHLFNIGLIKFEDGWKHLLYNDIENNGKNLYYFHGHDYKDMEQFENYIYSQK